MPTNPRQEYSRRLDLRRAAFAACEQQDIRIGYLRLAIFAIAALAAWQAWSGAIAWIWLALPATAFIGLLAYHQRVSRTLECARRAVRFYELGISRIDGDWTRPGDIAARFRDPKHPYADDLDIFVPGGLFDLLSCARTRAGENTLAVWLSEPASIPVIRERHAAIDELRDNIDLREELFILGGDAAAGVNPDALVAWARRPSMAAPALERAVLFMLALAGFALLALWVGSEFQGTWQRIAILPLVAVNLGLMVRYRRVVGEAIGALDGPAQDLVLFSSVLARIERESFSSPLLARLRASLQTEGKPASARIARLGRWVELIDSHDNFIVRLLEPVILWSPQTVFASESWRAENGPLVAAWISATGELEALASLAAFAYENPSYPFPELVEEGPVFIADAIAHPLLRAGVANDVQLDGMRPLWLVSGSNMSGKSTLLRSVGVNAILALAGSPVRAARLRISPIHVGASIRVTDSLREGASRFYAEITRIRQVLDLPEPCLFLLDELLHGTNSHDRRIGAAGIVRALLARGAAGLVTTHDLALADLPFARNVHFEDRIENGKMIFDYRLKEGVVEHSNALDLMRAVGLDV